MKKIIHNFASISSELGMSFFSVEGAGDGRALNAYEEEDDFLNTNCDTEDIEIF